jgi:tetratricopeptide (TPR) repeat protein
VRCPESDLGWLEPAVPELRRVLELDPGRKPPIRDGGTRVPSRRNIPPAARQISPVELLGKFYYNRGVQRLEEHQYAEGLALLRIALQLDPADLDARENLVAGLNNWAAQQCRAGSYGRAAELIEQGLALDAAFAPLVANQRLVKQKLASSVAFPRKP